MPMPTLRELGAGDDPVLDAVFAGLSPTSRFLRFHGSMPRMSAAVRDRLAAVDGRGHLAVAAFAGTAPIGIARLIVAGPGRAELAVEVVDAWQGRGVGRRLVESVVELGRARGVHEVVAEVLAENVAVQFLLFAVLPDLVVDGDGPELTYRARLSAPALAA
jgi:GNAT superfamily N-acetyltransferase